MKLLVDRETLLKPLQLVAGVVERRQTLPILSNVLLKTKKSLLTLIGTDLEIELQGRIELEQNIDQGDITVPARKFIDICRALPEKADVELSLDGQKLVIRSGRSRFGLATLPAQDFPNIEDFPAQLEFIIPQSDFRSLIEKTYFAMAQQDVRYYLNGMLLEVSEGQLVSVATDGHRMAYNKIAANVSGSMQIVIPRKGVMEILRLMSTTEEDVTVKLGMNQIQLSTRNYIFTTKLIDGKFPDYNRVIPNGGDKIVVINRDVLKQTLSRVAVLANEKHHGIRLELSSGVLKIVANNAEQEEAEEELSVDYKGVEIQVGFNVSYLLDVMTALEPGNICLILSNSDNSIRIQQENMGEKNNNSIYVVMPMRL